MVTRAVKSLAAHVTCGPGVDEGVATGEWPEGLGGCGLGVVDELGFAIPPPLADPQATAPSKTVPAAKAINLSITAERRISSWRFASRPLMDQCSRHDIPPAVWLLTNRRGHALALALAALDA